MTEAPDFFADRPGGGSVVAVQMDLFYHHRTNVASYPAWQEWLRRHQPPLLVLWGRFDLSFQVKEAEAYRRDVPSAEVHILDAGHFASTNNPTRSRG
jgi:pimeloyl-ACP methyl ester carboxylesterase